ncbi:hypothetical protein [Arthrobacter cryoconiti]|uniref:Uncharacterized protein n=1 Tax=Arthrobacter cryoconiti TaxID=748907 RepID=A0ABV8R164_9MICC|nr:hypothetical protein [Arthrobacter cryoconiti]MCC9068605.1 hypothetical protein [Arthrobacter cryoconiti]
MSEVLSKISRLNPEPDMSDDDALIPVIVSTVVGDGREKYVASLSCAHQIVVPS